MMVKRGGVMKASTHSLLVLSILLGAITFAQQQTSDTLKPVTLYFIKEYPDATEGAIPITNIVTIVEIHTTTSDVDFELPKGFTPVTLEDLHKKGYLSPSEARAKAEKEGYIDKKGDEEKSYYCDSWIHCESLPRVRLKRVYCGSSTSRGWRNPGRLWLRAQTKRNYQWVYDSGPRRAWGWSLSAGHSWSYPQSASFLWEQYGWHRWNGPRDPVETYDERYW